MALSMRASNDLPRSVVEVLVGFLALAALFAEVASLFHGFAVWPARLFWAGILLGLLVACASVGAARWRGPLRLSVRLGDLWPLLLCAALTFAAGALSRPNNLDSFIYHLARISHWIENRSIAFYPANSERQDFLGQVAEYAIGSLMLLGGGSDRLAFLIQWLCYLGSMAAAYGIARELGLPEPRCWLTAVLVATLPVMTLEASSTQNDLVVAFLVLAMILFGLQLRTRPGSGVWLGLCTGLAIGTKGTAYFLFPSLGGALLLEGWLRERSARRAAVAVGWAIAGVALFAGPVLIQNWSLYRSLTGPAWVNQIYGVQQPTVATTAAVAIRTLVSNLGIPSDGFRLWITPHLTRLLEGVGIPINDPNVTFEGMPFEWLGPYLHEDFAGNSLHTLLGLACLALVLFGRHPWRLKAAWLVLLGSALTFCAFLKWQPWGNRLNLPFFAVAAVLIGVSWRVKRPRLVAGVLMLCALPWLLFNQTRALLPLRAGSLSIVPAWQKTPLEQYFAFHEDLLAEMQPWSEALRASGCQRVNFVSGQSGLEYAFRAAARERGVRLELEESQVENATARLPAPAGLGRPCATVTYRRPIDPGARAVLFQSERIQLLR